MRNITRPAAPGGSRNERLAMFIGEGCPRVKLVKPTSRKASPNVAALVRPSTPNCVWWRVKNAQLHSSGNAGRVGKRASSDVFRGGPSVSQTRKTYLTQSLPERSCARSTLHPKLRLVEGEGRATSPAWQRREGRKTSVERCFSGRAVRASVQHGPIKRLPIYIDAKRAGCGRMTGSESSIASTRSSACSASFVSASIAARIVRGESGHHPPRITTRSFGVALLIVH